METKMEGLLDGIALSCPFLRACVTLVGREKGMDELSLLEIEMAVGETFINIIEHGYRDYVEKPQVHYIILVTEDSLAVVLCDRTKVPLFLEGLSVVAPDQFFREERERGLGLYIIKNFVDSLYHSYDQEEGNVFHLVKRYQRAEV